MSRAPGAGLTGVLGGTFDPIHLGHLRAAEEVVEKLGLRQMLFVPSASPPHKSAGAVAPAALRLRWVLAAIADNQAFEADDLELRRAGPSYSVDTMREIGARLSPDKPVFVLGWDAFVEMGSWRQPEVLLTLCHLVVVTRPSNQRAEEAPSRGGCSSLQEGFAAGLGADFEFEAGGQEARHRTAGTWARRLEISALDISATEIRERLHGGGSVRYLVPAAIYQDLCASGIYAEEERSA